MGSKSQIDDELREDRVSGAMNYDLLEEIEALVVLIEEIGRKPNFGFVKGENRLVLEIENLVNEDWGVIMKDIWVRVKEFRERLGCLSFGELVELVCELKRIEDKREMIMIMIKIMDVGESFWDDVRYVKEKANEEIVKGEVKMCKNVRRHDRVSESHRFERSVVLSSTDYLRFPSGRLLL